MDLDAAVVGITGPNHSGKSNLLKAVRWLLADKLDGTQDTHIYGYNRIPKITSATGELWFEKDGKQAIIRRSLGSGSKRVLEWDGALYTKAADVNEKMAEIMGADLSSVDKVMFIRQGELASSLFGTPSDRERLFTTILDVGYLSKSAEAIEDKIRLFDNLSLTGSKELAASLKERLESIAVEITNLDSKKRTLSAYLDDFPMMVSLNEVLEDMERNSDELRSEIGKKTRFEESMASLGNVTELEKRKLGLEKKKADIQAAIDMRAACETLLCARKKAMEVLDRLPSEIEEAEAELQKLSNSSLVSAYDEGILLLKNGGFDPEEFRGVLETLKDLSNKIPKLSSALSSLNMELSQVNASMEKPEKKVSELWEALTKAQGKEAFLKLRVAGPCDCPMCGTHAAGCSEDELLAATDMVRNISQELNNTRAFLKTQKEKSSDLTSRKYSAEKELGDKVEESNHYLEIVGKLLDTENPFVWFERLMTMKPEVDAILSKTKELSVLLVNLREKKDSAEKTIKDLEKVPDIPSGEEYDTDVIKQIDEELCEVSLSCSNAGKYQAGMEASSSRIAVLGAKLKDSDKTLAEVAAGFDEKFVKEVLKDRSRLVANLENMRKAKDELSMVLGSMTTLLSQKEDLDRRLSAANKKLRESEELIEFVDRLRVLRDVFKKGGLPSTYVERKFGELCDVSKEFLGRTDATFEIERDPDNTVGFLFRELDGPEDMWQPQESLSGGQKVRLSVAFLIAVQQILISDLGLLILDEPSQHLDEQGVESLRELLSGISGLMSDAGSQILVCDHREQLIPAYDIHIQF